MVTRAELLNQLPPYRDEWVTIKDDQAVRDIIKEITAAHKEFAPYYDEIAHFFDAGSTEKICDKIYSFLKREIEYREESEDRQTTALPTGYLTRGYGDCKHYAGFAGGVLDALGRGKGKKINWHYCFASYNVFSPTPYHVFVVVNDGSKEIWIDPTPGADNKQPVWIVNKKISGYGMPLLRNIAGIEDNTPEMDHGGVVIPDPLIAPLQVLLSYGILNPKGEYAENRYLFLKSILPAGEVQSIDHAVYEVASYAGGAIGTFFGDVFKGVQHFAAGLGMQVPRASFLGLVRINAFGYADKLTRALQYPDSKAKLADLWERAGGTFSTLENTIKAGAHQQAATGIDPTVPNGTYKDSAGQLRFVANGALVNAVSGPGRIGVVAPVVAAAAISSAAIIVAAIMPVIMKLVDKHGTVTSDIPLDPNTGLPLNYSGNSLSSVFSNPVLVIGAVAVLAYLAYEYS